MALPLGNYFRPVKSGSYNITFSASGFHSKTINEASIGDDERIELNVSLDPVDGIDDTESSGFSVYPNPVYDLFTLQTNKPGSQLVIFDLSGQEVLNIRLPNSSSIIDISAFLPGIYILRLVSGNQVKSQKILKN